MRQLERVDDKQWSRWMTPLDRAIDAGIRLYQERHNVRADEIAQAYTELGTLKHGQEPNYCAPGVPIAYAFSYLPQRVAILLGTLEIIRSRWKGRRISVLNIGSGCDATALAFSLMCDEDGYQ